MSAGLVLFAHGARDARWAAPFEAVADRVRSARPDVAVRLAFLELMAPDLPAAAAALAEAGCKAIDIVPLFLGTGGHVRSDLPKLVDALRAGHPGILFTLHMAIGETESVIAAMAAACQALLPR